MVLSQWLRYILKDQKNVPSRFQKFDSRLSSFNYFSGEDIRKFQEHNALIITSGNSKFKHQYLIGYPNW